MPCLVLADRRGFEALIEGLAIMATGGGGSREEGWRLAQEAFLGPGRRLEALCLDELEGPTATAYYVGSVAAVREGGVDAAGLLRRAFSLIERLSGRRPSSIHPVELGAANTLVAYYAAALLGVPGVDGDRVGRAAPEIHQDTLNIVGAKMVPAAIASPRGLAVYIEDYGSVDEYEAVARSAAVAGGGVVAVVDSLLDPATAKKALLGGSVSRAYRVGEALLDAWGRGANPVDAVVEALEGWSIGAGTVEETAWERTEGFLEGRIRVGLEDGRRAEIIVKNENLALLVDGEPRVLPPDPVILLDERGRGVLNNEVRPGMRVHIVAARAPEPWRTPEGLRWFGPQRFNLPYQYAPVEKLLAHK